MQISVVIPALNEAPLIGFAIESAWQAGASQVVVCDGGSRDRTVAIATQRQCQIVTSVPGRGSQLAAGTRMATGDLFVFLHADCRLAPACLDQIRQLGDRATWGCFEQRIEREGRRFRWLETGNGWRARVRHVVYGDQTMWVTRQAYQQSGGFDPVPLMEDVMLSDALRRLGPPVVLPGPVHMPPRHWQRKGVVCTTARNWMLLGLFRCGVSTERLAKMYR